MVVLFGFDALAAVFVGFGAHDEVDYDGRNGEDNYKQEPDWAFDDHFGNLLGNTLKFHCVNDIEDAKSGGVGPNGFVIK